MPHHFMRLQRELIEDGEGKIIASNNPSLKNRAEDATGTVDSGSAPGPPDRDVIIAIKNSEVLKPLPSLEIHLR